MLLLRNNLMLAFRHIRRDRIFSSINIFGLTISMSACLLIFQYAFFELNYDKQFQKDIYRVGTVSYENGLEQYKSAITSTEMAPVLKAKFPEITETVRLASTSGWFNCTLAYTEGEVVTTFNENRSFYFVDPSFVSMFSISFLEGDSKSALTNPYSIVLSASAAKKYFGNKEAIGKIVKLRGSFQTHDYTVTGVMEDFPVNSHLDVTIIASLNSLEGAIDAYTYIQLAPGNKIEPVIKKINALAAKIIPAVNKTETQFLCEPIADIYLHSNLQDQPRQSGSALSVYFLILVAVVVLVIAWINYINLFTSRSVARSKEVGIRKVTGATRMQIGFQFLTETFVLNGVSIVLSVIIVSLFSQSFYQWIGISSASYSLFTLNLTNELTILCALFFGGILLSGIFLSRLISSIAPVKVLKGKWQMSSAGFSFRKAAVVFQFSCAIALAVIIIVFHQQFRFMKEQILGVDIKNSIVLKAPSNVDSTYLPKLFGFKEQLKSQAIIHSVTTSTDVPGNMMGTGWNGKISKAINGSSIDFGINVIDPDFIQSYQLKLLAGRNFTDKDFPGEHFGDKTEPVIINRRGAELLSYAKPEDAIGETIFWGDGKCLIVGVLEEFYQESLKKAIQPMFYTANMGPSMTLKLTTGADKNMVETVNHIRQAWDNYFPDNAFDYFFLEDNFNRQYEDDERLAGLFNLFCLLALIISCLGIFALSLFAITQRMKEISIRKVLGASLSNLFQLLTKEYLFLIILSSIISLPVAYWASHEWLNGFAIKIELNAWLFLMPVVFILFIALLTVSSHAIMAVVKNPVDNLKHE
jgi:putative ABC transport system permease protein